MPRRTVALAVAAPILLAGVLLTGCTSTVSLQPAENANEPACADVTVRLPDSVDGQPRRWTDAQATGAWGDPASVIITCGVPELGPTTLPCQSVNGVDWVIDESDAPRYRVPWADLLRKVFAIDVQECPRCAGRLELIAFIADGGVARRILAHLGLATHPPPMAKARTAEDELPADPGPDYDVADPIYED